MIDLKSILSVSPECLKSRSSFKTAILAKHPNERRLVNVLTSIYECGLADKIRSFPAIDKVTLSSLISEIEKEYGICVDYIEEGVRTWANAFGVSIESASPH